MNRRLCAALVALVAAGCAAPPPQQGVDPALSALLAPGKERKPAAPPIEQALIPPLRMEMPQVGGQPLDARFDLSVSEAPAAQVFQSLAAGTRYSMLVHQRVAGNLTLNLKEVTIREALDSIRDLYGYEYKIEGTRIFVQPAGVQTRVFQANYLAAQRRGVSQVRVTSNAVSDPSLVSSSGTTGTTTTGTTTGTTGMTGAAGTSGVSGLLTGTGASGRESTRLITSQEATFWSDVCEALAALVFADGGGAPTAAPGTGTMQQLPEDRQRAICNRRHAQSDRSIVVSPLSGVIVVRATPVELRAVESYLRATQISVERQVMLEAKIIEVTLSNQFQSGVNWAAFNRHVAVGQVGTVGTTLGSTAAVSAGVPSVVASRTLDATASAGASGSVFGLALATNSFSALLTFLETQGNVQVLSSPRVAALNNQKALLKVGNEQLFVSNVSVTPLTNATTGAVTNAIATPQFSSYFSGIVLDVMPQIDDAGNITLHIHPSVSDIANADTHVNLGFGAVTLPTARSTLRETDTIVRVTDGNIVAIGGLMRTEVNEVRSGLPGVMDSAFGWLFRSTNRVTEKKEMVILLKPTIIDSDRAWAADLRDTQQRLDALKPPARGAR